MERDRALVRHIIVNDPRLEGRPAENVLWARHVAHAVNLETGEEYDDNVTFWITPDVLGCYLLNASGEKYVVNETDEIPREHMAHEFIKGRFAIVWKADAPDRI
jgi:hypothetical protein